MSTPIFAPIPVRQDDYSSIFDFEGDSLITDYQKEAVIYRDDKDVDSEEDSDQDSEDEDSDSVMSDTDVGSQSDFGSSSSKYNNDFDFVQMDPPPGTPPIVCEAACLLALQGIEIDDHIRFLLEGRIQAALCQYGHVDEGVFFGSEPPASPPPAGAESIAFLVKEAARLIMAAEDTEDDLDDEELERIRETLIAVLDSFRYYARPRISASAAESTDGASHDHSDDQVIDTGTDEVQDSSHIQTISFTRFHTHSSNVGLKRRIVEAFLPADDNHQGEEAEADEDDGNLETVRVQEWHSLFRRLLNRGQADTVTNIGTALNLLHMNIPQP